jgi:hypothetical protein
MQVRCSVSHALAWETEDGCSLLHALSSPLPEGNVASPNEPQASRRGHSQAPLFNTLGLQLWILLACQDARGLRDKPGKRADFYHTSYCLSGLSVSQQHGGRVLGDVAHNTMQRTDPRLNVLPERLSHAAAVFKALKQEECTQQLL